MDVIIREITSGERKWEDLNTDCLVNIFERVGLESLILHLPLVCKSWYKASLDPQCWKILDFEHLIWKKSLEYSLILTVNGEPPGDSPTVRAIKIPPGDSPTVRVIKIAVKRSCGMATKVVFPIFLYEVNIVQYVLERCEALKSLILPYSSSEAHLKCVTELINKWKDLESLTFMNCYHFQEILTQIHTHCKKFVSLSTCDIIINTEVALAIVTFIPNIKKLVLSFCLLDRGNLILILSGCRELELLDVRDCEGFDADDAEILSMASHIKTFMSEGSYVKSEEESDSESDYYYYGDDDIQPLL